MVLGMPPRYDDWLNFVECVMGEPRNRGCYRSWKDREPGWDSKEQFLAELMVHHCLCTSLRPEERRCAGFGLDSCSLWAVVISVATLLGSHCKDSDLP